MGLKIHFKKRLLLLFLLFIKMDQQVLNVLCHFLNPTQTYEPSVVSVIFIVKKIAQFGSSV